jgi:Ser-tRNA(Ala) deacylase AlaX
MVDDSQQQLYLDDTYATAVRTPVLAAGEREGRPWVALARNVFHPQGGGQPADVGTVEGIAVHPWRDGELVCLSATEEAPGWLPGDTVAARVDEAARRLHAALHTAGHLIDALLRGQGHTFVASNHFPGQSRVEARPGGDVDVRALPEKLATAARQAIDADLAVRAHWDGDVRLVTIQGLHVDPCGGTHVPSLGALARLTIRSVKLKSGRIKVGYHAVHG